MPKVCIYVPERQYLEARRLGLSFSELAQDALASALDRDAVTSWLDSQDRRALRAHPIQALLGPVDGHAARSIGPGVAVDARGGSTAQLS